MTKYVIVRHGQYNKKTRGLNSWGRWQMKDIVSQLLDESIICSDQKVAIFSSIARRTIESAEVIVEVLRNEIKPSKLAVYNPMEILLTDSGRMNDNQPINAVKAVAKYVGGVAFDVVIVISHYELAPYLVKEYGAKDWEPCYGMIDNGDAVVVYDDGSFTQFSGL